MNQPPAPPGGWGPAPPPAPPPGYPLGPPGGYGVGLPPGVDPMIGAGPGPGAGKQQEPMAVTSLVLGVLSVPLFGCCGLLGLAASVIGVVLGVVSLSRLKAEPDRYTGKPLAIAGLAINAVMTLVALVLTIFMVGIMGFGILSSP